MRRLCWIAAAGLVLCPSSPSIAAGHWALAFWRNLGQVENANNLFVRVWTFDENGSMKGNIPITTPTGTTLATTDSGGRVDFVLDVNNEYQAKVGQSGTTSDISPYMSNGRYPNWGHYSYELGFMYKSSINNPGTFDTSIVGGPVPRKGGTSDNAPCTASMAYYSFNPADWDSDAAGYDLPSGGWGEHGQTFVPNGNRVVCAQFHPTVGGVNNPITFTVEIRQGGPTGAVIASKTSGVHFNQDWWVVPFGTSICPVTPGQTYFARVYRPDNFNAYYARTNHWPNGLANGQAYWRANSGSSWALAGNPDLKGFIVCCNAAPAVQITNVAVSPSAGTAVIAWTTDVASTSRVDYGTTESYGKAVSDTTLVTAHSLTLRDLHADTVYHFKITSSAVGYDDGITGNASFITQSASPNLLINGGFETGDLPPWVKFGTFSNNAKEPYGSKGIGPWCTGKCPPEGSFDVVSICSYCTKNGGFYQQVSGIVPGATYTARMTYYTWQYGGSDSDCADRLGIDPYGGTNPDGAQVTKTPELSSQDTWTSTSISAVAQSSTITVFIAAIQKWPLQWNTNGFDDIRLTGPAIVNIPAAKGLVDGAPVAITGKVVTAVPGQVGAYYVQETSRTNGIRVQATSGSANVGDLVSINGWMSQADGERVIIDATITQTGSGQARPVGMNNRSVAGGDFNAVAKGASGGVGLNNVGLLVKTFGKVTTKATNAFQITDGSDEEIRVDASASATMPELNDCVIVTGICRLVKSGSDYVPCVKLRQTTDWIKVN